MQRIRKLLHKENIYGLIPNPNSYHQQIRRGYFKNTFPQATVTECKVTFLKLSHYFSVYFNLILYTLVCKSLKFKKNLLDFSGVFFPKCLQFSFSMLGIFFLFTEWKVVCGNRVCWTTKATKDGFFFKKNKFWHGGRDNLLRRCLSFCLWSIVWLVWRWTMPASEEINLPGTVSLVDRISLKWGKTWINCK